MCAAWLPGSGFETALVEYERDPRLTGQTKYPLSKMLHFALDGMLGFSMRPLRVATWLGLAVSAAAFVLAVVLIVVRLLGDVPVQGWTSLAVLVLLLGGVQLVTVGALGEYVGRIYNEVRGRPLYLVRERVGLPSAGAGVSQNDAASMGAVQGLRRKSLEPRPR